MCEVRKGQQEIAVESMGGILMVGFEVAEDKASDVYIKGPAVHVFDTLVEV